RKVTWTIRRGYGSSQIKNSSAPEKITRRYQNTNRRTNNGKRYKTLRSFPNGAKNCYTLTLNHAHNNSFRIRASFGYGNYDRKNQPPKFDLYLGVKYWATVNSRSNVCYEIIHVFPADTEYMCLVNTGSGTLFFFNGDSTFKHFHLLWKWVFVGTNLCRDLQPGAHIGPFGVRYIYDRIWFSFRLPSSVPINTSSNIDIQGSGNLYKLPAEVLRTVQPSNSSTGSFSFNSDYKYNVYFHYAEVEEFEDKCCNNGLCPSSNPRCACVLPTSTIPTFCYNPSDVDAIMSIKQTYNINRDEWQGERCIPKETSWSGLSCRFDTTPRIISLSLSSSKLTGEISPNFETEIGKRGFGKVFLGRLNANTPVAV
ncbi:hypothetical protein Gotur_009322, partial [Gossypium turneri]